MPDLAIKFNIQGHPSTKGSMRGMVSASTGKVFLREEMGEHLKGWMQRVRLAVRPIAPREPVKGPLSIDIAFRFERPKLHFVASDRSRALKPGMNGWCHGSRWDVDKLSRAILDALTGEVYTDDGEISRLSATKRWTDRGEAPGATITIETLT